MTNLENEVITQINDLKMTVDQNTSLTEENLELLFLASLLEEESVK